MTKFIKNRSLTSNDVMLMIRCKNMNSNELVQQQQKNRENEQSTNDKKKEK